MGSQPVRLPAAATRRRCHHRPTRSSRYRWPGAGEEVEEQADDHYHPADRGHPAAIRVDVAAGMGSGVGVIFAIMTTAAVTLGAHGAVQIETAEQAAQALRPLADDLAGRAAGRCLATRASLS
jgi:hypothetical protein